MFLHVITSNQKDICKSPNVMKPKEPLPDKNEIFKFVSMHAISSNVCKNVLVLHGVIYCV